jgi:hypothetical protein
LEIKQVVWDQFCFKILWKNAKWVPWKNCQLWKSLLSGCVKFVPQRVTSVQYLFEIVGQKTSVITRPAQRQTDILTTVDLPLHQKILAYLLKYLLTYLLIYLLTCLLTHLLTYLLNYLLTYLLTHLLTYLLTYLLT